MIEKIDNTFSAYLGPEFQTTLMWQILVEPDFAERIIPDLSVDYFDDPNLKRLFIVIREYFSEFGKPPNIANKSIEHAISRFKTPGNSIEEESLYAVITRINNWNEKVINNKLLHSGEAIQAETTVFIKQQEYRKLGELILEKTRSGESRRKDTIPIIEERILKISRIGDTEDMGSDATEGIENALRKEFREPTETGIKVIDVLTGGGLGKGECGFILTPSGVGKTTSLTKIANHGYECGKNVAHIIFEDTEDQIRRKHIALWSGIPQSELDNRADQAAELTHERTKTIKAKGGRLIIKVFSQENTTMVTVRNWMISYEKKHGIKFDLLVLDYLDCLESHKHSKDTNESELQIVKSFLSLAADFNIPAWTALQTNRGGFDAEIVEASQLGGNIKRVQKAHFFMSIAKPADMRDSSLANVKIIKARFAKDGQVFKNSVFDNDKIEIKLNDEDYGFKYSKVASSYTDEALNNLNGISKKLETESHLSDLAGKYEQMSKRVLPPMKDDDDIDKTPLITITPLKDESKELFTPITNIGNDVNDLVGEIEDDIELESEILSKEIVIEDTTPKDFYNAKSLNFARNDEPEQPVVEEKEEEIGKFVMIAELKPVITDTNLELLDPDDMENDNDSIRKMLDEKARKQKLT